MKKKYFTTLAIVMIISLQSFGQIKFKPQLYSNFGYESNIFRAPDRLILRDGSELTGSDMILSDSYFDFDYDLYFKYRIKKKHTLRFHNSFWNRRYSNYNVLNQKKFNVRFNYEYRINKKMHLGLKYRFDRVNKIATSVLGDELTRLYSYKMNRADLYFYYRISKNTDIELNSSFGKRLYDTTFGILPLDYNDEKIDIRLRHDFKIKKLELKANLDIGYSKKMFSEIIASDMYGKELNNYPLRLWNYYFGKFYVRGIFADVFEIKPFIAYKSKDDLFEDYYSYNSISFGINFGYNTEKLNIDLTPEYKTLNYLIRTAPDPNITNDPLLAYKYMSFKFKGSYEVYPGVLLSFEFRNKNRESNTLDFTRKTRRSYNYYEVMGGIIINPLELYNKFKSGKYE
ncbi:MAG: hypothetical protein L3J35_04550 [Bacteroidales bacterium]|nr:hypothetical protein [Bacteroidales bacterium]